MNLLSMLWIWKAPAELDMGRAVVHVDPADEGHAAADHRKRSRILVEDFRNGEVIRNRLVLKKGDQLLLESVHRRSAFEQAWKKVRAPLHNGKSIG